MISSGKIKGAKGHFDTVQSELATPYMVLKRSTILADVLQVLQDVGVWFRVMIKLREGYLWIRGSGGYTPFIRVYIFHYAF